MDNLLRLLDELEQLVENGKGLMGKRMVNEEEFFIQMQRIRHVVATRDPAVSTSKAVKDFVEESGQLSQPEQLQIVAALATRLAGKQTD
jgi:hypothetical protein